jgi:carbon monoxide dehydrogenase subunit G
MKLTMSHHFDHPAEEVWTMFHDPDSHVAKFTSMGHRDLEVLEQVSTDDSLDLTIRRTVELEVPSIAKKLITPTNTFTSTDHWERRADGTYGGRYAVDIKGVPAKTSGKTRLVAAPDGGADYTVELEVKVSVPLIGEKVAGALRPQLEAQLEAEFAACETWLADRG